MTDALASLEWTFPGIVGALRIVAPRAPGVVANICATFEIPPDEIRRWVDYPPPSPGLCYPDPNPLQTLTDLAARHGWTVMEPPGLHDNLMYGSGRGASPLAGAVVNAELVLKRLGYSHELAYNEWERRVEYRGADADDKTMLPLLLVTAESLCWPAKYSPTKQAMWDAVHVMAQRRTYNPVVDMLRAVQWDGFDRLSGLGYHAFGQKEDDRLANETAALIVRGAVVRALRPGSHFPYMPIVGSSLQGVAKRDALRLLSPGRYVEGLTLDGFDAQRKVQEKTRGVSIAEVGEINQVGGGKLEALKSLITDDWLNNREAYGRESVTRLMTAIMVGTTNNKQFLADSEHRRHPVLWIQAGRQIDTQWLYNHKRQIWAQAVAEFDSGRWWEPQMQQYAVRLPADLWEEANENSKLYEIETSLGIFMESTLNRLKPHLAVSSRELHETLRNSFGRYDNQEFSQAMSVAGWESDRILIEGRRIRVWKRKGTTPTQTASLSHIAMNGHRQNGHQDTDVLVMNGHQDDGPLMVNGMPFGLASPDRQLQASRN